MYAGNGDCVGVRVGLGATPARELARYLALARVLALALEPVRVLALALVSSGAAPLAAPAGPATPPPVYDDHVLLIALLACHSAELVDPEGSAPAFPFPRHVVLTASAVLPDVPDRDAAVGDAYDWWVDRYVAEADPDADGPRYRVKLGRGGRQDTVSEGQGYGMVIVATLAGHDPGARTRFDGLWRYAKSHPSAIDGRLMDWHVPADERAEPGDDDSAWDGDADIALGLLLADAQWGSDGAIDYRSAALNVIAGLSASCLGPTSHLPLLGDWVDGSDGFTEWTVRTSDWMPTHLRAFAAATGDPVWDQAVDAVLDATAAVADPQTGLLPDFVVGDANGLHPANGGHLEGEHDGDFSYNACRDPWRIGLDAMLTGDPRSIDEARRVSAWARTSAGGDPDALASGYTLNGDPLAGYEWASTVYQAPLGVAATVDSGAEGWRDAVWDAVIASDDDYFEDTVSLQCAIAMSGDAWAP